jgi:PKD repeat protein
VSDWDYSSFYNDLYGGVYDVVLEGDTVETGDAMGIYARITGTGGGAVLAYYNVTEYNVTYFAFTFVKYVPDETPLTGEMRLFIRMMTDQNPCHDLCPLSTVGSAWYNGHPDSFDGVFDFPDNNTRVEIIRVVNTTYVFFDGEYQDEWEGSSIAAYYGIGMDYNNNDWYSASGEMYIDDVVIGFDDWYDENWTYRRAFTVSNAGTSVLTDYQFEILVNTSIGEGSNVIYFDGKCQEDYDDIRFTNVIGDITYDYWIVENVTYNWCEKIWVKVDYVPPGISTVYMYYGNSTSSKAASGEDTFQFFDDFNDGLLDTGSTWDVLSGQPYSITDGVLKLTGSSGLGDCIKSEDAFGAGYAYHSYSNWNALTSAAPFNYGNCFGFNSQWDSPVGHAVYGERGDSNFGASSKKISSTISYGGTAATGWYEYKIDFYSPTLLILWRGTVNRMGCWDLNLLAPSSSYIPDDDQYVCFSQYSSSSAYYQQHNWVFVRKLSSDAGIGTWYDEESIDDEEAPISSFYANTTAGYAPLAVGFIDSSTNTPTEWYWDFGDGDTDTDQNPSHLYDSVIGNTITSYTVCLNASNAGGYDWENKSSYITLYPISADFDSNVTEGTASLPVLFTDDSDGVPTNWSWNFGGEGTSFDQNPVFTFTNSGIYNVTLNASNAYSWDIWYGYITVYADDENETTVNWDSGSYNTMDESNISYYINEVDWINASYYYFLNITDPSDDVIQSWEITLRPEDDEYQEILVTSANGFGSSGVYNTLIVAVDKVTGEDILLDYDSAIVLADSIQHDGTAIAGIVYDYATYAAQSGATVTLSNNTWSDTNTTSATGWYLFDNLAPSTSYDISVVKNGYVTNETTVSAGVQNSITYSYIFITPVHSLGIDIYDLDTLSRIYSSVSVVLTSGVETANTTATTEGYVNFTNAYDTYVITASCDGYTTYTSSSFVLSTNTTESIYLDPVPDYSSNIDYTIPPRSVRFVCQDVFGNRIEGVTVSARGYSTSLPDWGILSVVFGWISPYSNSSLSNDTMSGVTGYDGVITFMMTDSLQYQMNFTEPTRSIDDTLTLTPKDDTYIITLGTRPFTATYEWVNISLYAEDTNSSYTTLYAIYNDPNLHTTSTNFTVWNVSGSLIYSNVTTGVNSYTDAYAVSHTTGDQYSWGIYAVQTDYGTIQRYSSVTLHSRLIELGLEEVYYTWISIIFLFLMLPMFSGRNTIYGYVVIPVIAGMFYFIGWLNVTYLLITGVIILGIILFMSKRKAQGEGT